MLISHRANPSRSVPQSEKPATLSRSIQRLLRSVPWPKPTAQISKCESAICRSSDLNMLKPKIGQFQDSDDEKTPVWDCGSKLYDSFELNSIKRQIDEIRESDEAKARLWNCGSTLYDSFELNFMKYQIDKIQESGNVNTILRDCRDRIPLYDSLELDSINLHLDSATASRATSMPNLPNRRSFPPSKKSSKLSRSIQKLLPTVYQRKGSSSANARSASIREALEVDVEAHSPEISLLVRRTTSERFAANSTGIASVTFSVDRYFRRG